MRITQFPIAVAAIAICHSAWAQDMWVELESLRSAETHAAQLYPASTSTDAQEKPITIAGKSIELDAMYAALDERLPPLRIYSYSNDPDPAVSHQMLPTTFEPGSPEDIIVGFIRRYEAGKRGYDAIWHGSRHPLPALPTKMTVCEVREWQIAAAKKQKSTAIGLFQIVGGTYRKTLASMGLSCDTKFDARTQDRMGLALLYGRGWADFKSGTMSVEDFAYELAGEWAAFPSPYGKAKGLSRYHSDGLNAHQVELSVFLQFLRDLRNQIETGSPMPQDASKEPMIAGNDESGLLVLSESPASALDLSADQITHAAPAAEFISVKLADATQPKQIQIFTYTKD